MRSVCHLSAPELAVHTRGTGLQSVSEGLTGVCVSLRESSWAIHSPHKPWRQEPSRDWPSWTTSHTHTHTHNSLFLSLNVYLSSL